MIAGIGVDLVHLSTIERLVEAQTQESLGEIYTEGEISLCRSSPNPIERFATRFAAKEAAMKALGMGWHSQGLDWIDIEVAMDSVDRPSLSLTGKAQMRATELGVRKTWLSLCHEENVAIAVVVLEA